MGSLTIFFFTLFASSSIFAASPLVGHWTFVESRVDPPKQQADLLVPPQQDGIQLSFDFYDDGTNFLTWFKPAEKETCQRRGIYVDQGTHIVEIITWAHPDNAATCSQDPDMQMGRELRTPYEIKEGRLETKLHVGEQFIVYIWEKRP